MHPEERERSFHELVRDGGGASGLNRWGDAHKSTPEPQQVRLGLGEFVPECDHDRGDLRAVGRRQFSGRRDRLLNGLECVQYGFAVGGAEGLLH